MKRLCLLAICVIAAFPLVAVDGEAMLAYALSSSLEQGSIRQSGMDLAYIKWITTVEETEYDREEDYDAQFAYIEYLRADAGGYHCLSSPIYSRTTKVSRERTILYSNGMSWYFDPVLGQLFHYGAKATIMERGEDGCRLKEDYRLVSCTQDVLDGRQCWVIRVENTRLGSTTIFYLDSESHLRVREDYFERYPVLSQRTEYLDYWQLKDGTFVEKTYSIWGQTFPGYIRYFQIKDPRIMEIDDRFFESSVLETL